MGSRCEYHRASARHSVRNSPGLLNGQSRRVLQVHDPFPNHACLEDHTQCPLTAYHRLPPCQVQVASVLVAPFHQLTWLFTPISFARIGNTFCARSMLIDSVGSVLPVSWLLPSLRWRYLTFSPILRRSGDWKLAKARRRIGSKASKVSSERSANQ